jgi:hypothetical protein
MAPVKDPDKFEELSKLNVESMTLTELSEKLGISYQKTRSWLVRMGRQPKYQLSDKATIEEILYDYPYLNQKQLSEKYEMKLGTVRGIVANTAPRINLTFTREVLSAVVKEGVDVDKVIESIVKGEVML